MTDYSELVKNLGDECGCGLWDSRTEMEECLCLYCQSKVAIEALIASNTTLGNAAMSFEHELKKAQATLFRLSQEPRLCGNMYMTNPPTCPRAHIALMALKSEEKE